MTEPRDKVDDWLDREVEPLPPAPGAFERIHRRARRRKRNQAALAAAGAVVVVAVAVTTPHIAAALLPGGPSGSRPLAGGSASTASLPVRAPSTAPQPSVSPTNSAASQGPSGTALSTTTSGVKPPAHFRPTSITMISNSVGAVVGQAGPPCATRYCTSLAGTSDYGKTWYGVSAPVAGGPADPAGVSQLRFLNLTDGWAFGPGLYETSDGGRTWARADTSGRSVTDLETAGDRAFALFADCTGSSAAVISDCSTFSLQSAVAGGAAFQPVKLAMPKALRPVAMGQAGQPSSATIVLANGTGYLLTPAGDIFSGPLDGSAWTYVGSAPCAPGRAWPDGQPRRAQMSVSSGMYRVDCTGAPGAPAATQAKQLWMSSDGQHWTKLGQAPAEGMATALAGAGAAPSVLATTAGIDFSPDGATWQHATISGGAPAGGFSYVGMTSAEQGVAVPADASQGEVFTTVDGGLTWNPSPISGG